jgi:hypothetical protein
VLALQPSCVVIEKKNGHTLQPVFTPVVVVTAVVVFFVLGFVVAVDAAAVGVQGEAGKRQPSVIMTGVFRSPGFHAGVLPGIQNWS